MKLQGEGRTQLLAFALLSAASVYLTWSFMTFAKDVSTLIQLRQMRGNYKMKPVGSYSLIGADHPRRLPVERKFVKMVAEESVHYDILSPTADAEWLWTASVGDGHTRIGDQQRYFAVAMFHELHCIRAIRGVFEQGWHTLPKSRQSHLLHCFNYLRQYTLCAADTALEPGDFMSRNFTTERTGATHTCLDWEPSYEFMKNSWLEWDAYRIAHGIPWHDDVT